MERGKAGEEGSPESRRKGERDFSDKRAPGEFRQRKKGKRRNSFHPRENRAGSRKRFPGCLRGSMMSTSQGGLRREFCGREKSLLFLSRLRGGEGFSKK